MTAGAVLDLDLGNSSAKFRCGAVEGRFGYDEPLPELPSVDRIRIASVQRDERVQRLLARLPQTAAPEFAETQAEACGVRCGYREPHQLGVDRWLAAIAAYSITGGGLVADLGTAATLDYVHGDGRHLGGFIVPGWSLMQTALLKETAKVRFDATDARIDPNPGRDTAAAVQRGAALALARLLDAETQRTSELCGGPLPLVLTGGDAPLVASLLTCEHRMVPSLVLDGLALALG